MTKAINGVTSEQNAVGTQADIWLAMMRTGYIPRCRD